MAKKRKKDRGKEEEYEFRPPEFDERKFLKKELKDTRTILFTILYAAVLGVVAGLISMVSRDLIGPSFLLVIGGAFSLKYVYPLVNVDISAFAKKNWAGNIAQFFFTFLAVWVLLLNPPFADNAKPQIQKAIVWVERPLGTGMNVTGIEYENVPAEGGFIWVPMWGEALAGLVRANASYTVNITARVSDNGGLDSVTIAIGSAGEPTPMEPLGDFRWGYEVSGDQLDPATGLTFTIHASDKVDNDASFMPVRAIPVSP